MHTHPHTHTQVQCAPYARMAACTHTFMRNVHEEGAARHVEDPADGRLLHVASICTHPRTGTGRGGRGTVGDLYLSISVSVSTSICYIYMHTPTHRYGSRGQRHYLHTHVHEESAARHVVNPADGRLLHVEPVVPLHPRPVPVRGRVHIEVAYRGRYRYRYR